MRALITGGAGFVGHHLTKVLVRQDVAVTVLDIAAPPAGLSACQYHQGSVLDETLIRRLIQNADVVVHLAGIAEPMRYGSDPLATMDINLTGSINVVRRSAECGVPVVFASTSEIYGINPDLPWREDANRVLGPVSNVRWCYSTAKVAVEHYLDACRRQLGLDYTVVRLFNTYGSGLRGRVVDGFIRRALNDDPLIIHGDGLQTRCFCHVDDVADALVRIVTQPRAGGHTYNIGSDTEVPIAELGRQIIQLCDSRSTVRLMPVADLYDGYQDVPRRRPDISAIRRDFGWAPSTGLRDGLERMIGAMRDARLSADGMEVIGAQ